MEDGAGVGWVHHVSGVLVAGVEVGGFEGWSLSWPPAGAVAVAADSFYDQPGGVGGVDYGPAFQGVREVWRRDQELFVEVGLDAALIGEAGGFWGASGVVERRVACCSGFVGGALGVG
ncbi:polyketide synthase dehydratase domain-containing protein, partial [Mycobacterium szulgai]|uniref:polyketide synthase dehydratase domain-containing protein n=1 Tax=Mycobacterium szulgai TaxID=1787 RepID=UPI0021F250AF